MQDKIYVTRSSLPPLDEYVEEIKDLWETHLLTNMGRHHLEFKERLREQFQIDQLELFVSGHMSLELAIQAFGLRGEVITTPFTFASTTHAIVRNGLEPVFCDIREDDFTIDADLIESLITDRTCAIVPVHVYGNICEVEKIKDIAERHGLRVIYDAAHAFGVSYGGKSIFNYGDASICSFHATKVFQTVEGGMVCYRDPEIGARLRELRNFGIANEELVTGVGANAKMNELQAAMGVCNLRHFDEEVQKRRRHDSLYRSILNVAEGLILPERTQGSESVPAYFPVLIDSSVFGSSRNEVYEELRRHGIYARKYFYPLVTEFDCYRGRYRGKVPVAERVAEQVLCLPLYADLRDDQVEGICRILIEFRKKFS